MTPDRGTAWFRFRINVSLQDQHDPQEAIEWFVTHLHFGLRSGGLPITGRAPDGADYLWFPEQGKTAAGWLAKSWPAESVGGPEQEQAIVTVPRGMTKQEALEVLGRHARGRPEGSS